MPQPQHATEPPAIYLVIDQGQQHGPLTEQHLAPWYRVPFNLLFDTTKNEVHVKREDNVQPKLIELGPHREQNALSSVLELLRVFAERPGVRLTRAQMNHYTRRGLGENRTFIKYIERLRKLLKEAENAPSLILTDRGVDTSVSETGCAYYANPDLRWRVIRYVSELSSGFPP